MELPTDDEESEDSLDGELPLPDESSRDARPGFVPEFVRKVAVAGLGALFMTEEGLRSLAGQLKLPKEALGFILSQAEKTKDDLGRVLSDEVGRYLRSDKLRDELLKFVSGLTIEVKAEVRLKPPTDKGGGEGGAPRVEISEVRTRRVKTRTKKE